MKDVPDKLKPIFRPSIQPYLMSLFRGDPAKLAAAYPGPILVVSGSTDIQIPQGDGERLISANPKARHVVITGMNHILKPVESKAAAHPGPGLFRSNPPAPSELVPELVAFLKRSLGEK